MEMCYAGAIAMPSSYVVMNEEEMTYTEGGYYISNQKLKDITWGIFMSVAFNPIGTTLCALGIQKVASILMGGWSVICAKIGVISKAIGIALEIVGIAAFASMGYTVADALIQGKGINIGIKKTWFGMPYGIDTSVE